MTEGKEVLNASCPEIGVSVSEESEQRTVGASNIPTDTANVGIGTNAELLPSIGLRVEPTRVEGWRPKNRTQFGDKIIIVMTKREPIRAGLNPFIR